MIEFTPAQKEIAEQLKFTMVAHWNMDKHGELIHSAEYKGMKIIKSVVTPKKNGVWGKGKQSFYIDEEKKEYKTPHELLDELIKRTLKPVS